MSIFEASRTLWTSRMLSVFRIVAGLMFFSAGAMKIFGVAGLLEVVGGAAIVLGLFTRPVAFVLAGETAVAYFYPHFPQLIVPTVTIGMLAVLYCFLFLYLMFVGAGVWSLDALIARRKWVQRPAPELERRPRLVHAAGPALHRL